MGSDIDLDIDEKVQQTVLDSINYIQSTIMDETAKPEIRSQNARWMLEKYHLKGGKGVEVGSLQSFMEALKGIGTDSPQNKPSVVPIKPVAQSEATLMEESLKRSDDWDDWINENT